MTTCRTEQGTIQLPLTIVGEVRDMRRSRWRRAAPFVDDLSFAETSRTGLGLGGAVMMVPEDVSMKRIPSTPVTERGRSRKFTPTCPSWKNTRTCDLSTSTSTSGLSLTFRRHDPNALIAISGVPKQADKDHIEPLHKHLVNQDLSSVEDARLTRWGLLSKADLKRYSYGMRAGGRPVSGTPQYACRLYVERMLQINADQRREGPGLGAPRAGNGATRLASSRNA
ncbi:hypothetical protein V8D89_000441 [Ganoderma adspersum]